MPSQSEQLSQKIAAIQARQETLMQETAQELEVLKTSLEESIKEEQNRGPLIEEIKFLRSTIKELEQERRIQDAALRETQAQLEEVINSVKKAVNLPITAIAHTIPKTVALLPVVEEESFFEPPSPIKKAIAAKKELPALPKPAKKTAQISPGKKKRLLFRGLALTTFIGLVYITATHSPFGSSTESGQVAGVSTQPLTTPATQSEAVTLPDYAESYSDIPFEDSTWEKTVDPEFGISIEYPKNTTNRVATVGGNNIWFLRKSSYLVKLSREQYNGTLDAWMAANKEGYEDENTITKNTFKNQPAWFIQPLDRGNAVGYEYILEIKGTIYHVWVQQVDPTTDDGQRIARMITSLQFTK